MLAWLPVASTTTSQQRPAVSPRTASSSTAASPEATSVSLTPIESRTNASRWGCISITITRAPESLANSTTASPIGPAPMIKTVSPGLGAARSIAWQPIANVSTSAFWTWVRRGEG